MRPFSKLCNIFDESENNSEKNKDNKSNHIFYKIINFDDKKEQYWLQCINTNAVFRASLLEIMTDESIIKGLHPIQACYLGLEYVNKRDHQSTDHLKNLSISEKRYGRFCLIFQDRKQNIYIYDEVEKVEFKKDPIDVAFSETLISEFDAIQAFFIGVFAGLKGKRTKKRLDQQKPRLYIIK